MSGKRLHNLFDDATRRLKRGIIWHYNYACLRKPKVRRRLVVERRAQEEIAEELKRSGIDVRDYHIDVPDYRRYIQHAEYQRFPEYYEGGTGAGFVEKSLEHYLAAKMLALGEGDVYIDIANCTSPAPEIYHALYGCTVYRQDLTFPEGVHGNSIGGDAGEMPVEDGFATKMALHCSFEHFEGDADIRFTREAGRVLKMGGRLCILPLYFAPQYAIQTNPAHLPIGGQEFDSDAVLYCAKTHDTRHGRHYDVGHFLSRVVGNVGGLALTMYVVKNAHEVDPSCYVYFAGVFEKGG
jgi:hypothetical protein